MCSPPCQFCTDPCLLLSVNAQGKQAVTELQSRAQFSLWAIVAAPMLISGSVLKMSDYTLATYSNAAVIAVSQDPMCVAGTQVSGGKLSGCKTGDCTSVWARPLTGKGVAVAFLNVGPSTATGTCDAACELLWQLLRRGM